MTFIIALMMVWKRSNGEFIRFLGAYASNFVWWDVIFGTDKGYWKWREKQKLKNA